MLVSILLSAGDAVQGVDLTWPTNKVSTAVIMGSASGMLRAGSPYNKIRFVQPMCQSQPKHAKSSPAVRPFF